MIGTRLKVVFGEEEAVLQMLGKGANSRCAGIAGRIATSTTATATTGRNDEHNCQY